MGENKGKSFVLAPNEYMDLYLGTVEAYNAGDVEREISFYEAAFGAENREFTTNWHASIEKVTNTPAVILPVRLKGSKEAMVLTWSNEDRLWKNGSSQKMSLMEVYAFDENKKINGFSQWYRIDPDNEFGRPIGGKFFGETETDYTGRPLVFSNRGEVEILEQLMKDYNDMNAEEFAKPFADVSVLNDYKGKAMKMKKKDMAGLFSDYKSVNWVPYAIVPLKIYNTDAASGVQVMSKETRVFKNGRVWEKELFEIFYFDLEGKITSMTQYARDF